MQSRPFTRRTPDLTDFPPEVKCARGKGFPAIDVEYLAGLGYDTLPSLIWLADRSGDHPRAAPVYREAISDLESQLKNDLDNWRGWTYRRARMAEAVRCWERDTVVRSMRWPTNVVRLQEQDVR
jgi:hypothetical protein